jgi:hypothetical protein
VVLLTELGDLVVRNGNSRRHGCNIIPLSKPTTKNPACLQAGFLHLDRQRSTLPPRLQGSTIDTERLNFRVRNGNGCDPLVIATGDIFSDRVLSVVGNPFPTTYRQFVCFRATDGATRPTNLSPTSELYGPSLSLFLHIEPARTTLRRSSDTLTAVNRRQQ